MADRPSDAVKRMIASLPLPVIPHRAKLKDIRKIWDTGCAKTLADAQLTEPQRIQVVTGWLDRAGGSVGDFVIGRLLLSFSRPLPVPPTPEEKLERSKKSLVRSVYNAPVPHLRAINSVVGERLEETPHNVGTSFAQLDTQSEIEHGKDQGTLFAEFKKRIEDQSILEYQATEAKSVFGDAAE